MLVITKLSSVRSLGPHLNWRSTGQVCNRTDTDRDHTWTLSPTRRGSAGALVDTHCCHHEWCCQLSNTPHTKTSSSKRRMSCYQSAPDSKVAPPSSSVALCDVLLVEARSRIRIGKFDARLDELVFLAGEILDDLDAVLVQLDPLYDSSEFAVAARLHRDLEQVQSAIPSSNRGRPPPDVRVQHAPCVQPPAACSRLTRGEDVGEARLSTRRCPRWSVDRVDGEVP